MSKNNHLEQKRLRRERRELHKALVDERYFGDTENLKKLYKDLYEHNFSNTNQLKVDRQLKRRSEILLADRLGKREADLFIKQVEDEYNSKSDEEGKE